MSHALLYGPPPIKSTVEGLGPSIACWVGMSIATLAGTAWANPGAAPTPPQPIRYAAPLQSGTTRNYQPLTTYERLAPTTATWENRGFAQTYSVMHHPAVNAFLQRVPAATGGAVQQIFDLARQHFGERTNLGAEFTLEEEETGPTLFLSLDTHGMDFDAQWEQELAMRSAILADPHLAALKRHVVISVV